jgi:hypothetical protein
MSRAQIYDVRWLSSRRLAVAVACIAIGNFILAGVFSLAVPWSTVLEKAAFQKFLPVDDDAIARQYITLIEERQYASIERTIDPALVSAKARSSLQQAASLLTGQAVRRVDVVGFRVDGMPGQEQLASLTYEVTLDHSVILAVVSIKRSGAGVILEALRVLPLTAPLEKLNAFTFEHKGMANYLWMLTMCAIGIFVVVTLLVCANEQNIKLRWLWMLIVCLGFVQFSLNWTTGAHLITPISFSMPGIGFVRDGPYAPWIVTFALPLGACTFWLVRRRLTKSDTETRSDTTEIAPAT